MMHTYVMKINFKNFMQNCVLIIEKLNNYMLCRIT